MNVKTPLLSFVIPCHNERDNLGPLLDEIAGASDALGLSYEVIVTDDASTDGSWETLLDLRGRHPSLRAQRLAQNAGESAASIAGIRAARGAVVVTMDGDRQNDPADLPKFIAGLDAGADCVCGSRVKSRAQGDTWVKKITSRLANRVRAAVLGDSVSDAGCTYRAFRRECADYLPFFRGVHRFIPILMAMQGFKVAEVDITNRSRAAGQSHYGLFDRAGAVRDMLGVRWLKSRHVPIEIAEHVPSESS